MKLIQIISNKYKINQTKIQMKFDKKEKMIFNIYVYTSTLYIMSSKCNEMYVNHNNSLRHINLTSGI